MATATVTSSDSTDYEEISQRAIEALCNDGLVIFPTETVYGVAANAGSSKAMERLRELKGRRSEQPFTLHIGRREDAALYLSNPSPIVYRLARRAWPGPLTLVSPTEPQKTAIAGRLNADQLSEIFYKDTVGLRYPAHPVAERLLSAAGVPVVATSANRASEPPPTTFDATTALLDEVDFAFDAGWTMYGEASTVVELQPEGWRILRPGVMEERTIRRLSTCETLMLCTGNSCRSPLAEYLLRHELAKRLNVSGEELSRMGYVVWSAGTFAGPGQPMSRGSLEELSRRGISGAGHGSQPLTVDLARRCERIYVMSPEHREAVLNLAPELADRVQLLDDGPVSDPVGGTQEDYARCAEQIEKAVQRRAEEILNADRRW